MHDQIVKYDVSVCIFLAPVFHNLYCHPEIHSVNHCRFPLPRPRRYSWNHILLNVLEFLVRNMRTFTSPTSSRWGTWEPRPSPPRWRCNCRDTCKDLRPRSPCIYWFWSKRDRMSHVVYIGVYASVRLLKSWFAFDPTKLTNVSRDTCLRLCNQGRWGRRCSLWHCLGCLRALDLGLQSEVEEGNALLE